MYDVITFGSATVDAFAKTGVETISINRNGEKDEFIAYETGSKIIINDLDFQIGGGGTNTAVSFSRMSLSTAFCGCLGNDSNADLVKQILDKENIDFVGVEGSGQTGYSMILDSCVDDRTILTFKGVNNQLKYSEINKNNLKASWFYFSSLMGESYKTFVKLTSYAKKKGINVAFNPSSYLAKKGLGVLKTPLKNVDLLVLNFEEAKLLAGNLDIKNLLLKLSEYGPSSVVITCGSSGAYALYEKDIYFVPSLKAKVYETTGAGDAFASGFLSGLIYKDIKYALKLGVVNSTSVIKHIGAKNKLLRKKAADKEINKVKLRKLK
ncbi:MAG: carbohydrate kinase family protein [Nanobdellota archaeon]